MTYFDKLKEAADWLASQSEGVIFVGQAVEYKGTGITNQLKDVPNYKKLELPVAEDFQAGFCIGLALQGFLPVSVYPRWNFALLAANQIINHLDKWEAMSDGESKPRVLIKVVVGSVTPLDPGHQHKANYTEAFKHMVTNIDIYDLKDKKDILPAYKAAYNSERSSILVEYGDKYNEK